MPLKGWKTFIMRDNFIAEEFEEQDNCPSTVPTETI
jgi:hypothetical protein